MDDKQTNWCKGFCRTCGTGCAQYCDEIKDLRERLAAAEAVCEVVERRYAMCEELDEALEARRGLKLGS